MTLLDWLIRKFPRASRQTLRRMVQDGRVRVNVRIARAVTLAIQPTDVVHVTDRIAPPTARPARLPFEIVFEDDDVLVINKPVSLLTATNEHEKRPTALAAATEYLARNQPESRIGLVHRLDRDASGLLVFSKNPGAYHSLKEQFFRHTVERIYHAIVDAAPTPASGIIDSKLIERTDGSVEDSPRGQRAVTEYRVLKQSKNGALSLLRVKLHTGRKHQIRAHLAGRGWPIVNDPLYDKRKRRGRLMLCATELAFDHPRTSKRRKFELPLPKELAALVR